MIETALHYAAKGWQVFPLLPNDKRPATDNGFKAATTQKAIIEGWWLRWPDANVGIVTGAASGIVVLDVDRKHGVDGVVAATELDLPETLVVRTPSGGFHLFFTLPKGVSVGRRIGVKPGLDILGDGGYVVAAGSRVDGAAYEIVRNRPMVPCPDVLVNLAAHHKAAPVTPVAGKVVSGGRNQYLASLAGKLRRMGSDETEIAAALLAINEQRNDPPLPEAEVRRTALSIARYAPATTGGIFVDDGVPEEYLGPLDDVLTPMAGLSGRDLLARRAAKRSKYATTPFDPEGRTLRLYPGGVTIWSGYPGSGKTTIIRQSVCQFLSRGQSVFLASLEEEPGDILTSLADTASGRYDPSAHQMQWFLDAYHNRLHLWGKYGIAPHKKLLGVIRMLASKGGLDHAVIDSLMCLDVPNDDYEGQRKFANELAAVARATGVHIHLVAHPRKQANSDQQLDLNDVAGAREIGGIADNVLILRRAKSDDPYAAGGDVTPMVVSIRKQRHFNGAIEDIVGRFHRQWRQLSVDPYATAPNHYLPDDAYESRVSA
jgi:KaiC/GvpD/RAD55 family RecA-like ATPase